MRRALFRFVAVCIAAPCCGPDARPPDCSNEPDFILEITAEDGPLPADTEVVVEYGGGSEESYLLDAEPEPRIMFCMPHVPGPADPAQKSNAGAGGQAAGGGGDGGADGEPAAPATRLECELWTQGPAIVEITGGDYALLHEDLKLARDECTLAVDLALTHDEPTE